jgi:hypothetical protein
VGSLIYLALIPLSAYRYFQLERVDERRAKAQNGKGPTPHAIAEKTASQQSDTELSAKP